VAETLTVLQWSRLSDHIGRKPVLLTGLTGLFISMVCFGLSRSFTTLVIRSASTPSIHSSCLSFQPMYRGSHQWKHWRHEVDDGRIDRCYKHGTRFCTPSHHVGAGHNNRVGSCFLMHVTRSSRQSTSHRPLIGGILSKPHEHYPKVFGNPLWEKYPYLLPCAVVASFTATAFLLTAFFLREARSIVVCNFHVL
jgi:hypothetical protein